MACRSWNVRFLGNFEHLFQSADYLVRFLCYKIIFELCKHLQGVEIQTILIIQFKHIALQCSFTKSHLFNHLKFISYE